MDPRTDVSHRAMSPRTPRDIPGAPLAHAAAAPRPRNPGAARVPRTRLQTMGRDRPGPARRPVPERGRRNLIAMLLITALAVTVGLLAYRFGVSLRTAAAAVPGQTWPSATTPLSPTALEDSPLIR